MRQKRKQSVSDIYHVVNRGTGHQNIFENNQDKWLFLDLIQKAKKEHDIEIFAWCLMDNHFHLLVRGDLNNLSNFLKALCAQYAQYFNLRYSRTGHLFQSRYLSECIEDDSYLIAALRYIHANPEKAGICKLEYYPWSSYSEYVKQSNYQNKISDTDFILEMLDGIEQFRAIHQEAVVQNFADIEPKRTATSALPDKMVSSQIQKVLPDIPLGSVKSLPKNQRNNALIVLRDAGLSIRQIERLTGISRGIIQKVKR